jgi:hypothetical protein
VDEDFSVNITDEEVELLKDEKVRSGMRKCFNGVFRDMVKTMMKVYLNFKLQG